MKRLLTILMFFIIVTPLFAQHPEFPVYDDFSLPNPGKAHLSGSMTWRIYGHLFDIEEDGTPGVMRISYGDNPYGNRELFGADKTSYFTQLVYNDGISCWLRNKYGSRRRMEGLLLEAKFPDIKTPMHGPVGMNLP